MIRCSKMVCERFYLREVAVELEAYTGMSTETNKTTNHIILEKNTQNCRYINKTDVKNCYLQFSLLNKTKQNVQMIFYLTA